MVRNCAGIEGKTMTLTSSGKGYILLVTGPLIGIIVVTIVITALADLSAMTATTACFLCFAAGTVLATVSLAPAGARHLRPRYIYLHTVRVRLARCPSLHT